ncbi:hypothetical protein thsps21_39820 [Pseudomonas sp. No.21]|uniref:hypothetical protein n=1 Tax=Pseudomonas TaxID=286 RepID=UPI000DA96573|nr:MULTISPECIES: hypothetical protein [Pseudomonas]MDW3711207.1 hypothetical protein [Pseudomonas sp. 2023EL-01195]PZE11082.1 hypothetical protein DMX10_22905 [Pseudomonas sp. 57B-090624]GJN47610.1 hypothetical protein TUM20249_35960 [Pseudomonas tohonis]
MITHIPALEFMQHLAGTYRSLDDAALLQITRSGHGQMIELRMRDKVQMAGVVGAAGQSVELFALFGFPNVIHLSGQLKSKSDIAFEASDLPVNLLLSRDGYTLTLTISFGGTPRTQHVLKRV